MASIEGKYVAMKSIDMTSRIKAVRVSLMRIRNLLFSLPRRFKRLFLKLCPFLLEIPKNNILN